MLTTEAGFLRSFASTSTISFPPLPVNTPFESIGGIVVAKQLARHFYDVMARDEPALLRLHPLDSDGRVASGTVERFTLFLVEWLGGPAEFSPRYGHPRLRMRHGRVPVDSAMRDAWVRAMTTAMQELEIGGEVRAFLERRFFEVADFLRNSEDPAPNATQTGPGASE